MNKMDVSKQVTLALIDVQTIKLNKTINDARKRGEKIIVQLEGELDDRDWSRYDGTSIEQGIDVKKCTFNFKVVKRAEK